MDTSVYVAGLGVISAIGNNTAECIQSFENRQAGIEEIGVLNTIYKNSLPAAEVKLENEALASLCNMPSGTSRTALLSHVAAKMALDDALPDGFSAYRTGFISANSVGGMDKTEEFFISFLPDPAKGRLKNVINHECGNITELVADSLGIRDYVTTISTACSSSANSIAFAARLIKHNILDVAVAGGADSLTRFTLNGFNSLMILDEDLCKPFDRDRKGLNLGEGAGYVVLVSERVAESLKNTPYCRLSGYCNANDAYHQTASSPEGIGAFLAMEGALKKSGLFAGDVGYINLHGTGTQNNDSSEAAAIKRLFDPFYPKMSSTKSFTGHTLGACGGIEAVFSALSVQKGYIYPNLRFENPPDGFDFAPETRFLKDQKIKHVLSNSFGFGGNCSSLVFSQV